MGKKCIQNFDGETSWPGATSKATKVMGAYIYKVLEEIGAEVN
jgi:hypothetical protein